jgi:hypothetical protein
MTSKVNVTKVWRFIGKTRRHEVELRHNTLSGKQLLSVNGEVLHKVRSERNRPIALPVFQKASFSESSTAPRLTGSTSSLAICTGSWMGAFASFIFALTVRLAFLSCEHGVLNEIRALLSFVHKYRGWRHPLYTDHGQQRSSANQRSCSFHMGRGAS